MADELEILKSDWQKKQVNHPKLSYNEIYKMLFKRSTSIVKWILIISIAELILWLSLTFFTPQSTYEILEIIGLDKYMVPTNIFHYAIFTGFIILFFKNYRTIKVTDNTKRLMSNILKTRKTVRYFVIYNIVSFAVYTLIVNLFYYFKSDVLIDYLSENYTIESKENFMLGFFVGQAVFSVIMILLIILFYRLVYGILLKRLKKNYNELAKMEV